MPSNLPTLRKLLFILFLLLPLASACQRGPHLTPLPPGSVILAFGDSLTFGTGASSGQDYPAVLSSLVGHPVVNAGVPGETSELGLARLPQLLATHQPALLVLCHGGNDLLQHRSHAELEDNLKKMVQMARAAGVEIILIGVPEPGLLLRTAPLYQNVANELHVPFEDEILADILQQGALKSDYIHPNAQGYTLLAEAIAARINDSR